NELLGHRKGRTHCLPCPGPADQIIAPTVAPPIVRSAFNLADHRNKNADRLIRAIGIVSRDVSDVQLELIGGGSDHSLATLKKSADRHAPGRVRFCGPIPHAQMQAVLSTSAAFALVSHRESFGMVFAEALLSGVPCLIPKGRAIDGYFPEGSITLSANPSNKNSIASGLLRLLQKQSDFKARLLAHQQSGKLDFLRRDAISQVYASALSAASVESRVAPRSSTARRRFAPA
ncbi:MAG: glycosyltransferase, partial [Pseudomonadota bacterium]